VTSETRDEPRLESLAVGNDQAQESAAEKN
jgi:hypothetical protein